MLNDGVRSKNICTRLQKIYRELSNAVDSLSFAEPITHVYNPLNYARDPSEKYLAVAGASRKETLFLGMNPGPWGMAQTGVPFGTVNLVRDWICIEGPVGKPPCEHPKRPIVGFGVEREEVSGNRFWGWAKERFDTADKFFERFFVATYCPLAFMEASGRNRTPDKLPAAEKAELFHHCDHAFRQLVQTLEPDLVIGIGKFAEVRAKSALADLAARVGRILHPSPASPIANRGWQQQAESQLVELGVRLPAP